MNFSAIKTWFATVDISHTDWRMRWPLLLLPLIMLSLLFFLLRANQLSGDYANHAHQLRQQMQSVVSAQNTASNANANAWRPQLAAMHLQSEQLSQWLQDGKNTLPLADYSNALTALVKNALSNGVSIPNDTFWRSYSENLAELENGVMSSAIRTPEAKSAVQNLRVRYAQTRAGFKDGQWVGGEGSSGANNDTLDAAADSTVDSALLTGNLARLEDLRSAINRMQNFALIAAALGTALFAMLLWGLWQNAVNRRTTTLGKVRNEQDAILRLLDEITPLAQGDLRINATVSEASTGAIADAVNYAVSELRRLVHAVTDSADLVKVSVAETRDSAQHLAKASSVQAREIHRSSNYLSVMSDTMAQLSAHAVESSRIADVSVQKARAGNLAVQDTVNGLQRIREQADMTTRLMQRLVETASSINERVVDIQAVAKRTDLLALNATIRTASAAGGGMQSNISELSDDVAYLAETLGRTSRDIANLSDLIEQDANLTLESMSKTVVELNTGQRKAQHASANLLEIDRVSHELNGLISDIASKSLRQAGVVKQLSANMGVINNITHESATQLQGSAQSLELLQKMTAELRASVSDFTLPGNAHPSPPTVARSNRLRSKRARARVPHV